MSATIIIIKIFILIIILGNSTRTERSSILFTADYSVLAQTWPRKAIDIGMVELVVYVHPTDQTAFAPQVDRGRSVCTDMCRVQAVSLMTATHCILSSITELCKLVLSQEEGVKSWVVLDPKPGRRG